MQILMCLVLITFFGEGFAQELKPEEYIAAVLDQDEPICAGAFLGRTHVVTSAKCVLRKKNLKVAIGSATPIEPIKKVRVLVVNVHPYYREPMPDYDVAVLKVDTDNANRFIIPLDIPVNHPDTVNHMFIGGWNERSKDKKFLHTDSLIVERQKCVQEMTRLFKVNKKLFCLNKLDAEFKFIDGNPAALYTYGENKRELMGIGVKSFGNGTVASSPLIYLNIGHPEIAVFLQTIIN